MSDESFSPEFGSPYQVLVDHCESAGLKFRAEPDVKGVFFSMRGEMAIYDVALLVTHEDEVFPIYLTIPIAMTDEKFRPLVAEFVTPGRSASPNHSIVPFPHVATLIVSAVSAGAIAECTDISQIVLRSGVKPTGRLCDGVICRIIVGLIGETSAGTSSLEMWPIS